MIIFYKKTVRISQNITTVVLLSHINARITILGFSLGQFDSLYRRSKIEFYLEIYLFSSFLHAAVPSTEGVSLDFLSTEDTASLSDLGWS